MSTRRDWAVYGMPVFVLDESRRITVGDGYVQAGRLLKERRAYVRVD